jgi:CRP-like cAMP-binding protein
MYNQFRAFLQQFVSLSEEDFLRLQKLLITRKLEKKEFLTSVGDLEQYIYYLHEGLIHQYFYLGKEMITIDLVPAGTTTNAAVSFLSGKPSHYFLQAMEPCVLVGLAKRDLEYLYHVDRKWQQLGRKLINFYLIRQENNMINNIRMSMRERFLQFAREYPTLMERVPQRRLASYLHIEPETFTRLKPLLKPAGR